MSDLENLAGWDVAGRNVCNATLENIQRCMGTSSMLKVETTNVPCNETEIQQVQDTYVEWQRQGVPTQS